MGHLRPHITAEAPRGMSRSAKRDRSIGSLTTALIASAVGTAAMDSLLYRRYHRGGGTQSPFEWEFSAGVTSWSDASAPGLVGKGLLERILGREVPGRWARSVQNIVHWATGMGWSVPYALVVPKDRRSLWTGAILLGPIAWLASYVILPFTKVYKPIWEYDLKTLAKDLSAHMVYGITTGAIVAASTPRRAPGKPDA